MINAQLAELSSMLAPMWATMVAPSQSALLLITQPEKHSRDPTSYEGFKLQCSLYFSSQGEVTKKTRIAQFINMLTDTALRRATAIWIQGGEQGGHLLTSLCHSPEGEQLLLRQGNQNTSKLALTFHTVATGSNWNKLAMHSAYCQGLNQDILTELACCNKLKLCLYCGSRQYSVAL